jgi:hypothetical protein
MKKMHYGSCVIGVALAAVLLVALGVSASTLTVLAVALICPLLMFIMMRTMMDGQAGHTGDRGPGKEPVDPRRAR